MKGEKSENNPGFTNILPDLEHKSDLMWAFRSTSFPTYKHHQQQTPEDAQNLSKRNMVMDQVLKSNRVRNAVQEVADAEGENIDTLYAKAKESLEEMAHAFSCKSLRAIGYPVHKAFQSVFSAMYVNLDGINKLREMAEETPILYLPTHRTYMDFLLVSHLCFTYDLTPPAIATGMDFLGMKFIGEALRQCGAFYIKRQFGNDKIYWSLFTEYVQHLIVDGERGMEFFLEGTRSRTMKTLYPKTGLLTTALEPFFKRSVYDITIVPVSITYSKILEETLYAYELLGFPKPKESTSGLLKARSILESDFGDVWIEFSQPMSARSYFHDKIQLGISHNLSPEFSLTPSERVACRDLAHQVTTVHQQRSMQTIWPYFCLILLQLDSSASKAKINYNDVLKLLDALLKTIAKLGIHVPLRKCDTLAKELDYYLKLHSNLLSSTVAIDDNIETDTAKPKHLPHRHQHSSPGYGNAAAAAKLLQIHEKISNSAVRTSEDRLSTGQIDSAVPRIILGNYGNSVLHSDFISLLYFVTAQGAADSPNFQKSYTNTNNRVFNEFSFLRNTLFQREFVTLPSDLHRSFHAILTKSAGTGSSASSSASLNKDFEVLQKMLHPFLLGYWFVMEYFLLVKCSSAFIGFKSDTEIVHSVQKQLGTCLFVGLGNSPTNLRTEKSDRKGLFFYQILSTDLMKNAVNTLFELKIVSASDTKTSNNNNNDNINVCNVEALRELSNHVRHGYLRDYEDLLGRFTDSVHQQQQQQQQLVNGGRCEKSKL